jgi:hypothetical protein
MNLADKTGILGQLWIQFRDEEEFETFMEYNDIGLPMAYYVAEGLVKDLTPLGEQYIIETFDMFSKALNITEEEIDGLDNPTLDDVLQLSYNKKNPDDQQ